MKKTRKLVTLGHFQSGSNMPRAAWRGVLLRDRCVYCGSAPKDLDHIYPEHWGGPDGWENLAPACKPCNLMKADGSLMWMLWRLQEKRRGRFRRRVVGHRVVKGQRVPIATMLEYQGMLAPPEMLSADARIEHGKQRWLRS